MVSYLISHNLFLCLRWSSGLAVDTHVGHFPRFTSLWMDYVFSYIQMSLCYSLTDIFRTFRTYLTACRTNRREMRFWDEMIGTGKKKKSVPLQWWLKTPSRWHGFLKQAMPQSSALFSANKGSPSAPLQDPLTCTRVSCCLF